MPRIRAILLLAPLTLACSGEDAREMRLAREVAGPGALGARRFRAGDAEWAAAARPAGGGGAEVVVASRVGGGWSAPIAPGLRAHDAFAGDERVPLERLWGVADADGDSVPEVWAARVAGQGAGYLVELRAYSVRSGALYRLLVPGGTGPAWLDPGQREFSFNVMDSPRLQRWMTTRAESVAAEWSAVHRPRRDP